MPLLLVVIFVAVPLVELVVIMRVSELISIGPTVVLLVADSIFGAWLLRHEGRKAWAQFRDALQQARWPGDEVTQGGLIIVGGTLLLTPGFVTDVVGFLLLLAPTRTVISRLLRARLTPAPLQGAQAARRQAGRRQRKKPRDADDRSGVLDVEVVEIRRDDPPSPGAPDPGADAIDPGTGHEADGDDGPDPAGGGGRERT
jgi:UPF0716 protein FxsA